MVERKRRRKKLEKDDVCYPRAQGSEPPDHLNCRTPQIENLKPSENGDPPLHPTPYSTPQISQFSS